VVSRIAIVTNKFDTEGFDGSEAVIEACTVENSTTKLPYGVGIGGASR